MMLRQRFRLVQCLQKAQGLRSIQPFSSVEKVSGAPSFVRATTEQVRNLCPQLDGIWHGQEVVHSPELPCFYGSFLEGLYHGFGYLHEKDGSMYEGNFAQGAKNGEGCLTDNRGVQIKGIWSNNVLVKELAHLSTTMQIRNDSTTLDRQKGNKTGASDSFLSSKNERQVKQTNVESIVDYKEGKRGDNWNGEGVKVWPNGDRYEGDLLYGKPHGQGTKVHADGAVLQGEFRSGKICNGRGVVQYDDGSSKEGTFVEFQMEGHGKRTEDNGDVYEGGFLNDRMHGEGVVTFADGRVRKVLMEHGITLKSIVVSGKR